MAESGCSLIAEKLEVRIVGQEPTTMPNHLRVLIVDDHRLIRKGLKHLLQGEPDIEVVGEACNGCEAVELARSSRPDAVIMDLQMPIVDGVHATRQIMTEFPATKVLIVSNETERSMVHGAMSSGASGFLSKQCSLMKIPAVLRELQLGRQFMSFGPKGLNA